ncbi:MAG: aminoacyl-tRNA hydrolase, partial [Mycoplasmoidaceae bacterium]|nr:aminoacyl-tRNA hydrolase [Mycoplasmoidaceae bacterium]
MDKLLIVGLGNYPKEYENTRHNIGFNAIDLLSKELNIELTNNKFNGIYGYKTIGDKTVYLAKPYTFMNLSGEFIQP